MCHYIGGYTPMLEEELVQSKPKQDDIKDALAAAVEIALRPAESRGKKDGKSRCRTNSHFGGVTGMRK